MTTAIKKIAGRMLLITGVFALVVFLFILSSSRAVGETFATNGIDLRVDSEATYNGAPVPSATWELKDLVPGADKFFNFDDIKPGDYGENTISLHVKKTSAWLCLDFTNLVESENGVNEPESHEDENGEVQAELASSTQFFAWRDDGDNIFEPHKGEKKIFDIGPASEVLKDKTYVVGDSKSGGACGENQSRYIGIYWCAGDLSVDMTDGVFTCDGTAVGNAAQTDSFSVDMSLRAEPSKDKPKFVCGTKPPTPPPPHPDPKPDPKPHPTPTTTPPFPQFPNFPSFPHFPSFPTFPKFPSFSFFR